MGQYYHTNDGLKQQDHELHERQDGGQTVTINKEYKELMQDGKKVLMFTALLYSPKSSIKYAVIAGYQLKKEGNTSTTEPIPEDKRKELSDLCIAKGWAEDEKRVDFWKK